MSTNAICASSETGFVCKHCTPEQMKESARKLLNKLVRRGNEGKTLAMSLIHGKCVEYNCAINIERYRRGWVNNFWFDMIGCPIYVYDALKNEEGLPQKTLEALRRYEELHPEALKTEIAEKIDTAGSLGVFTSGEKIWVSSRDVAEKFGKPHNDVLKAIRGIDCSPEFNVGNFSLISYRDSMNREKPEYLMTRDGFTFLAMGFTGAKAARFKEAYISEFNRMEEELYKRRYCAFPANTGFSPLTQREATALATAAAASKREQATRRRLYKALDTIERLQSRIDAEKG